MSQHTIQPSDGLIERAFARRAPHGPDPDLRRIISTSVRETPQVRRWWPIELPGIGEPTRRLVWMAVVVGLVAVVAFGTLVAGGPHEASNVAPVATTSPTATPEHDDTFDWIATGSLRTPRTMHTATRLQDGRVLVVGGAGDPRPIGEYEALASVELYDPATQTWTPAASLAEGRIGQTATLLADGRILVAGGVDNDGDLLRSAELYDPATDTWRETGGPGQAHEGQTATLMLDGTVLIAGGHAGGTGAPGASSGAEVYDPTTETWAPVAGMRVGRIGQSAALLPDGQVLIAGGYDGFSRLASAELFDPQSRTWSATGDLPETFNAPATALLDGTVLLVGGDWTGPGGAVGSAHAARYDPATGTWTTTAEMGTPRLAHAATLLGDGRVLVSGGQVNGGGARSPRYASAEVYDPTTQTWTAIADMAHARAGHTATLMADGSVLVAGGLADDCADGPACASASAELLVTADAP